MNTEDLTNGQAREPVGLFAPKPESIKNGMVGKYVIVRCRDAGVHTGVLESHVGRECVLTESRRLWYWVPAEKKSFLSGVAVAGLAENSKVGAVLQRIHLTENCEIMECSPAAEISIRGAPEHVQ